MAISIKEPCNEDWSKMTHSEKGAHCQQCALEVIDFTNKTSFEIKGILAEEFSSGKRVCGRISNYQLDQLNDDFFQWKNDNEAYRAVWIFSLVAVFGLTLFSCQHAPTREMIEQLNVETIAAMRTQDTLSINLIDSSEITTTKDSISPFLGIPWNPEIITYMGVLPYDWGKIELFKWISCEVVLGDFVVSGSVISEPKVEVEKFLLANPLLDPISNKLIQPNNQDSTPQEEKTDQQIQAVNSSGEKKFEAFVYPNPIEISSRLFLNVFAPVEIDVSLRRLEENEPFRHGFSRFEIGKHQLDLNLFRLERGDYELNLLTNGQLYQLNFVVQKKVIV